jgi:sugar phosphate isomerase/epimerase
MIRFGVDTLCWHLRLEHDRIRVEQVLDEAAELGVHDVQLNLHHVRERPIADLPALADRAAALGLTLLASGDFVGSATRGEAVEEGVRRVDNWLARASAIRSPILRVASGFYRAELAGQPDLIAAEERHVTEIVRASLPAAERHAITLLLENHSDFSAEEYARIVENVRHERFGVFLDVINPISALDNPVQVVGALAPFARAGHVKDYVFKSIQTDDAYHRRGFSVLYRYPGEGVAPLAEVLEALRVRLERRDFVLSIEGLDNRADVDDQRERLERSLRHLRDLLG